MYNKRIQLTKHTRLGNTSEMSRPDIILLSALMAGQLQFRLQLSSIKAQSRYNLLRNTSQPDLWTSRLARPELPSAPVGDASRNKRIVTRSVVHRGAALGSP